MVLLKNAPDGKTGAKVLPLTATARLAVVGPHAVSHRDLLSDYIVDQLCWKGPCVITRAGALLPC